MAYQSFGSYGSFKFAPDLGRSRKILQVREEERAGQDRYQNLLKQQQTSYLDYMRQKLRSEQTQRDRNFQLEQEFNKQYQDAKNVNMNTERLELEAIQRQSGDFARAMADLSMTLGKKFIEKSKKDKAEKDAKEQQEEQRKFRLLTPEEKREKYRFHNAAEALQSGRDSAGLGMANNLEKQGVPSTELEPIRQSHGGTRTVNQLKAQLIHVGAHLSDIAAENKDYKFDVVDPDTGERLQLTYEEGLQRGGAIAIAVSEALTEKTAEHFGFTKPKSKGGLSTEFVNENFYDVADSYHKRILAENEARLSGQKKLIAEDNASRSLLQGLHNDIVKIDGITRADSMANYAIKVAAENSGLYNKPGTNEPDLAYIRDNVIIPELRELLESGGLDDKLDVVESYLLQQRIKIPGSDKFTSLANIKTSVPLNELFAAVKERKRSVESAREQEFMAAALEDTNGLIRRATRDGVFNPSERTSIKKLLLRTYKGTNPKAYKASMDLLENYAVDDSVNINQEERYNEMEKAANNGNLKPIDVQQNSHWLGTERNKKLLDIIEVKNPTSPELKEFSMTNLKTQGEGIYRKFFKKEDTGKILDGSVFFAKAMMPGTFEKFYAQMKTDPALASQGDVVVHREAFKATLRYVEEGLTDPTNPFYAIPASKAKGNVGYVAAFKVSDYSIAQSTFTAQQRKEIIDNPSNLSTTVYLSDRHLDNIESAIDNGRMIPYTEWTNNLARDLKVMPYEIVNSQLKARGSDRKIKPGYFDKLAEVAQDDAELSYMAANPTLARRVAVTTATGNAPDVVPAGDQGAPAVAQLAHVSGSLAPPILSAMWKVDTANGDAVLGSNNLFSFNKQNGQGITPTQEVYNTPLEAVKVAAELTNNIPGFKSAMTYGEAAEAIARLYPNDPNYANKLTSALSEIGFRASEPINMVHTGNPTSNPLFMSKTVANAQFQSSLQLTPNETEGLATIRKLESDAYGSYNAYNLGGKTEFEPIGSGDSSDGKKFGKPLIQMTLGEIIKLGDAGKIHATGAYQFTHNTGSFKEAMRMARLTPDDVFTPENQDKMAILFLRAYGPDRWSALKKNPQARAKVLAASKR